ncbi:MAG: J domain-containing protein [Desulfovibrionaceae bacterium]|nr:J domain-containing protein [Desulfovibrionaceae bacterium]
MSTTYKDYYKLLGVDRKATDEEITRAFKKLARKYHPDLNPNNKKAEENFKEVNEAYEVLKDPQKRKLYDQLGPNWQHGQAFQGEPGFEGAHFTFNGRSFDGSGFSDFFETLFGGGGHGGSPFGPDPFAGFSQKSRRGRDIESELFLSLEDVVTGGSRQVTVSTSMGPKSLSITIPKGIAEGKKLRLSGQGEPSTSGIAGDLFLTVRYKPHERFRVDGENLVCDVHLAPWEALFGCRVAVPTLEGSVELSIPPGTSSGKKFRLRGKGLGSPRSRGDILVQVMIRVPQAVSGEEEALWRKLAEVSSFRAHA